MPTFTRAGATIAYTDTGAPDTRPDAPTIVFGHGLLFSGWMFSAQIAALQADFRCVAIDWRGQGASPVAERGYDMDTLTDDAAALITELGVAPVHWVGLSMGGFVGMRLAARRPELVRSLTLLNTSAHRESPKNTVEDLLLAGVYRTFGIGPVRGQVEQVMFGPSFRADPDSKRMRDEWIARLSASPRGGVTAAVIGVVSRKPVLAELGRITAPTLVAAGEYDRPTPPARGRAIAGAIAGARFETIAGSGHSSTIERPDEVTRLIREHVSAR
ncbi:MAG: alpha/beta fold hydrolase [Jatrophihabitans sp.]|uniref:alpha/beta fold hydrolase n=1 Tax=Jatrophihabitans sp. TaxID=1932789 RepID=UPI003F7EAD4E